MGQKKERGPWVVVDVAPRNRARVREEARPLAGARTRDACLGLGDLAGVALAPP